RMRRGICRRGRGRRSNEAINQPQMNTKEYKYFFVFFCVFADSMMEAERRGLLWGSANSGKMNRVSNAL
ncbi:MAG TPA: hypothetical protein VHM90_05790, partial [Phycisphaerae bacterium]|nr:hypothetical protein [Phycisphaerae bacterium]